MPEPRDAIMDYLRSHLGLDSHEEDLLPDMPLREIIDSVDMIEFINFLESRFSITIADEDITPETFSTPRSTIMFIEVQLKLTPENNGASV